ncbi:MAG: hypothetical protein JO243_01345, partial [Solirubrobacterales bacterium]|nr:hypothetical protein [Solirubrobacterales bacterium]
MMTSANLCSSDRDLLSHVARKLHGYLKDGRLWYISRVGEMMRKLALGLAVAICAAWPASALADTHPAREADAFVDSVGINTHLHYQGTVYDTAFKTIIRPKLLALGIRHVRDGAYTYAGAGPDDFYYQRCR